MSRPAPPGFGGARHLRMSGGCPCPYMPDREERKLWTILGPDDAALLDGLTRAGFRRSGRLVYRPACAACEACKPVRVALADYAPSRSLRRALGRNADLTLAFAPPRATAEHFALFTRYVGRRHADGGMADMTAEDFARMVEETTGAAQLAEWRDPTGRLQAGCLIDRFASGLSAVYSYFEPDADPARSLGTTIVASLALWGCAQGLSHLYLGYWIAGCSKMAYKKRFQPLEVLDAGRWRVYDAGAR